MMGDMKPAQWSPTVDRDLGLKEILFRDRSLLSCNLVTRCSDALLSPSLSAAESELSSRATLQKKSFAKC